MLHIYCTHWIKRSLNSLQVALSLMFLRGVFIWFCIVSRDYSFQSFSIKPSFHHNDTGNLNLRCQLECFLYSKSILKGVKGIFLVLVEQVGKNMWLSLVMRSHTCRPVVSCNTRVEVLAKLLHKLSQE